MEHTSNGSGVPISFAWQIEWNTSRPSGELNVRQREDPSSPKSAEAPPLQPMPSLTAPASKTNEMKRGVFVRGSRFLDVCRRHGFHQIGAAQA